jgi:allantoinase
MRTRFVNLRVPVGGNATEPAELVVDEGRIVSAPPAGSVTCGSEEQWINLGGALVLPGVIDGHVHFNDPGFAHREDFSSGTTAAAAGGVTCVVDMPCTSLPPVTSVDALRRKLRIVGAKAHVDYMLWGGVAAQTLAQTDWREQLAALVERGVPALKVYTLSGMESFGELSYRQLEEVLKEAARLDVPVGVHAEDPTTVRELEARLKGSGHDGPLAYAASRPAQAEAAAVAAVAELAAATGARVHIVHLGSAQALEQLLAARKRGVRISCETCPHFLEFTTDDLDRLGSKLKTAPVVKSAADRDRLWLALAGREIAFVTTDHAAGQWPEEKHTGSFWTDYGGIPGVELLLPYLHSAGVCSGRITLERLVELTATGPARFFGIHRRKGRLEPGFDADFVVFDDTEAWTVRADRFHNLNRYTPFEGMTLTGRVRATYVRGQCAFRRSSDGGELFGPAGLGEWVRREATKAAAS